MCLASATHRQSLLYARRMARMRLDVDDLSTAEKLELLDELWVSLSLSPAAVPLTATQVAEIDARIADMDTPEVELIPWQQVRNRVTNRGE